MRSLDHLAAATARSLAGVVFDLDGTLLTRGALTLEAYGALHRLRQAGLRLIACTGRPAGWGAVIARHWPIDLAVTENGAIAFGRQGGRIDTLDRLDEAARRERARKVAEIVAVMRARFGEVPLADDNPERRSDATFDVRETVSTPQERIVAMRALAAQLGARTFESSIHLHVTLDADDKASGTVAAIARRFGEDRCVALARYAFVGDSGNDEACFSAFRHTFAVANVERWVARLSVAPRFVSLASEGAGFVQIAERLATLRSGTPP
jgi:HAD superfamily hydrolase (TIGR01484 family)